MTFLIKIIGLILISLALAVIFKGQKNEYVFLIGAVCVAAVSFFVINALSPAAKEIKDIISKTANGAEYFKIAFKALAVALISEFAANLCRDSGQSALSFAAELGGKSVIFILCVPLFTDILKTAVGFLKL